MRSRFTLCSPLLRQVNDRIAAAALFCAPNRRRTSFLLSKPSNPVILITGPVPQ